YIASITPTNLTDTGFKVAGVVQGSTMYIDYLWKLPRVDVLALTADGQVEIEIAADGMEARLVSYAPPIGGGKPLSVETLREQLRRRGVTVEPDAKALAEAVRRVAAQQDLHGLVVARGVLPKPAQDAFVEAIGDHAAPVFPGDIFARKSPPQEATPGMTVTGAAIPAAASGRPRDLQLVAQAGWAVSEDKTCFVAQCYGLPQISGNRASVHPLIEIAADRMAAKIAVYPLDFQGKPITPQRLAEAAAAQKINRPLQMEALVAAVERSQATGQPQRDILLCAGIPPQPGEDGRVEFTFSAPKSVGALKENGSIDFRDRGILHAVAPGEILARLIPPTPGRPGEDVFGQPIPAPAGRPASLVAGENVKCEENGTVFRAAAAGMTLHKGNTISVTEVYEIAGDVDYHTGNVIVDKGSVVIRGTVRAGFRVSAPGNVVVGETVEKAEIAAGGDIEVRRGVLEGRLVAGGAIRLHFGQNATLEAGRDVLVDNDLTNCRVISGGQVIAMRGRGRIQGGVIRCGQGCEVNEIGSELGVATEIIVGLEPTASKDLAAERETLLAIIRKIERALGTSDARTILLRTPPAKRPAVAALLKARLAARQRIGEIDNAILEESRNLREQLKARVKVKRTAHAGVTINIGGVIYKIAHTLNACQFYLDSSRQQIHCASW
ncbi:MAG: FapA family protein, partial [Planctomycetota bacterium]|nr:FapA family protein [Planctomycetota bacterium]